ncbi:MAG: DNA photolyase family protein [Candidatus Nanopelagicales bacterium]|nr:DNA photolyase family protein [Candidatus Nanopelagicales bacterium]
MPSIMWFRRDLRIQDNPALLEAGPQVLPLFILDPALWDSASNNRRAYLAQSLRSLNESLGGALVVRHGKPANVLSELVREIGADSVHIAADFGPYGQQRDREVEAALAELSVPLIRTGSPYAVAPGRVLKGDGTPFRVFTPFYKNWVEHGWREPARGPLPTFVTAPSEGLPTVQSSIPLPEAGEDAAWRRWKHFKKSALAQYSEDRNRPDLDGTSMLSHSLKYGEIHPRSLLAELAPEDIVYIKEICWREFYADILFNNPQTVHTSLDARYDSIMPWASGPEADSMFDAWCEGRTGYPIVDAGMRQLVSTGWMHNRVRMITASFLVKDLHIPWQRGAQFFMQHLVDGDLASNTHGWQWTAGCGTDASPFYRVFNPITQGLKFDPNGEYVRRYVPELDHLAGGSAHEPWDVLGGYDHGYPEPIVDHKVEREVALADFASIKGRS